VRVLFVNGHGIDTSVGGTERYVADLERGCRERGIGTAVLSAFPAALDPTAVAVTTRYQTDWRTSRSRRLRNHLGSFDARATPGLHAAILRAEPDVVHTSNLTGFTTGVWGACAQLGVPIVHTLHDYSLLCARTTLLARDGSPCSRSRAGCCDFRARRLGRWAASVGAVVGVSQHILQAHEGFFPDQTPTYVVLHPRPAPDPNTDRPVPSRVASLGYLGSLDIVKGVDVLLAAVEPLSQIGVRLRIAGDGRLRRTVEAAAATGLLDYHGVVSGVEKSRFLAGCSLGAVPSVWAEPGAPPFTALEWLAACRPVICSLRGGLGEAARSLPGMIAVEPTVEALVGACSSLLDPVAWRRALDAAAMPLGRVGDHERWISDHVRVYESVA
jgi:glycosyltransferase involved in cell wall biosynthesis